MFEFHSADGTAIFYKDWSRGRPLVFCHDWLSSSDSWEPLMPGFADRGYRCIAHDRRGHGRSADSWSGHDMDTYADDLAALLAHLDLHDAVLIGQGCGSGEAARYIGRHGCDRVAALILISTVTPTLAGGAAAASVPRAVLESLRDTVRTDRAQLYRELAASTFFGYNRAGAAASEGIMRRFRAQAMRTSLHAAQASLHAFSQADFSDDLVGYDGPTLLIHGADNQILPLQITARRTAMLMPQARLRVIDGAPHGLVETHHVEAAAALTEFLEALGQVDG